MSDLAEQILAAAQADENAARRALSAPVGQTDHGIEHWAGRIRRCAADREIVALHVLKRDFYCSECGIPDEYPVRWPCPTLRALARGYGIQP